MIVGYARTSTTDQTAGLEGQERDLRAAGAERVFTEQVSSIAQRAGLKACLQFLRDGDALMVTKPDRLARNTGELLTIEADLSARGIGLVVLSMGGERLDTWQAWRRGSVRSCWNASARASPRPRRKGNTKAASGRSTASRCGASRG